MEAKKERFIKYEDKNLKGFCLKEYETLRLSSINWEKNTNDERPNSLVKASRTRRVAIIETESDTEKETLFAKRAESRNLIKAVAHIFAASKAMEEWNILQNMKKNGIPAARPVVVAEDRGSLGYLKASYLVTRKVPGVAVSDFVCKEQDAIERRIILSQTALFISESHKKGFYHDDANANHIFAEKNSRLKNAFNFYFIDVDNSRLMRNVPLRLRRKNLFQFLRSFPSGELSKTEKLAFLKIYYENSKEPFNFSKEINYINNISMRKNGNTCI